MITLHEKIIMDMTELWIFLNIIITWKWFTLNSPECFILRRFCSLKSKVGYELKRTKSSFVFKSFSKPVETFIYWNSTVLNTNKYNHQLQLPFCANWFRNFVDKSYFRFDWQTRLVMINETLQYNSNLTKTQIPSVVLIIKLHSKCKTRSPNHNEIISGNDFD